MLSRQLSLKIDLPYRFKTLIIALAPGVHGYLVFKILFVTAGIENKGISRRSSRNGSWAI